MPERITPAKMRQIYLDGRYCIGCQAINVPTDSHGYCANCAAYYDATTPEVRGAAYEAMMEVLVEQGYPDGPKVCICNKVPCECPD